ncbi:DUF1990 domain-containing protein [Corynebacterium aquilae]|uniref:DUF1990 domain-containing protein n=1 Tax=Corynebacterium aquilae TaxID=203263 RepID=UPI0014754BDD|nr:DUF1990 domain-containing protein [Corynebacterium aquilae]
MSYPAVFVGRTLAMARGHASCPRGWHLTDVQQVLGCGEDVFDAAWDRVRTWQMHNCTAAHVGDQPPAEVGQVVSIQFRPGGVRVGPRNNPCVVVDVVDTVEPDGSCVRALIYGTLDGHAECGEEAFVLTLHTDGTVVGRCVAFSRQAWWVAKCGRPLAQRMQKAAAAAYVRAMVRP